MPRTPYLMTRRGRWYWRRRVAPEFRPEASAATGNAYAWGMVYLSLYTDERLVARHRAAALDAGFERWVMGRMLAMAEPGAVSLAEAMARLQGMTGKVYNSGIELAACAEATEKLRYDSCIKFDELARRAGR